MELVALPDGRVNKADPNFIAKGISMAVKSGANLSTYLVRVGDYMQKIAREHNVPLYALIRANPQIKDPNTIYPGQILQIPTTIGPPMLPKPRQPKVPSNVPDLPVPSILPPSLEPIIGSAVIQEVYIKYKEFEQDPELGGLPGPAGIITDAIAPTWKPWKICDELTVVAAASSPTNPTAIAYARSASAGNDVTDAELVAGIRVHTSVLVVQYRYTPFQAIEPDANSVSVPCGGHKFRWHYEGATRKDPPKPFGDFSITVNE
jgi:LysM repeat protein